VSLPPRVVILAAGASARLGEPKALVDLGGRAALAHLIEACGESTPLVISGAHSSEIAAAFEEQAELLEHTGWSAGRTSSIASAVRHLPGYDILLAPVDSPLVPASVFEALRETWQAAGAPARGWLSPRDLSSERHGHPILIGRELAAELLPLAADAPLRSLRALADPLLEVGVDSPEILDNLDTPLDLAQMRARF
jgi:molybdenum cofactor cytidylyltransferase